MCSVNSMYLEFVVTTYCKSALKNQNKKTLIYLLFTPPTAKHSITFVQLLHLWLMARYAHRKYELAY